MERLTYRLRNQLDEPTDRIVMTSDYAYIEPEKKMETVLHRLAAIEDILGDEYDLDELREVVQAKREGRCVVLPAKMGDDVWLIVTKRPKVTMPEFSFVKHSRMTWTNIERVVTEFGKTVFRTPEEAQAVLERMKGNG